MKTEHQAMYTYRGVHRDSPGPTVEHVSHVEAAACLKVKIPAAARTCFEETVASCRDRMLRTVAGEAVDPDSCWVCDPPAHSCGRQGQRCFTKHAQARKDKDTNINTEGEQGAWWRLSGGSNVIVSRHNPSCPIRRRIMLLHPLPLTR